MNFYRVCIEYETVDDDPYRSIYYFANDPTDEDIKDAINNDGSILHGNQYIVWAAWKRFKSVEVIKVIDNKGSK